MNSTPRFVFFGTPELAVTVLDELEQAGYVPAIIITKEDKPTGRHMVVTPPPVKMWAEKRGIPVLQPTRLRDEIVTAEICKRIKELGSWDLFIVAAYGQIIPQAILDIPLHGSLNVHPSLLPRLRGPSPIESAILSEDNTGVSIMLLDAEMDHGPVLVQQHVHGLTEWPVYADVLENILAHQGGSLLAQSIQPYLDGTLKPVDQDHTSMTVCKKITKQDGLLDIDIGTDIVGDHAEQVVRKVRAYSVWPRAYFFHADQRIIVTRARLEHASDGTKKCIIERVIPEGRKEMDYADFLRGLHKQSVE